MTLLTSEQVNQLADNFLDIAKAIGNYRFQNFGKLSKSENRKIKELQASVLDYSDNLYTLSATLVMEAIETSLSSLASVTTQITDTYTKLEDIQKAINVATSVVTLGESILTKNPQAIADSISRLIDTWGG